MPSNLEVTEQSEVTIQTAEIGKWKYLAFGIGIPPTKFEPRLMSVGLNKDYSTIIHFKNPFKENINITITLEAEVYCHFFICGNCSLFWLKYCLIV